MMTLDQVRTVITPIVFAFLSAGLAVSTNLDVSIAQPVPSAQPGLQNPSPALYPLPQIAPLWGGELIPLDSQPVQPMQPPQPTNTEIPDETPLASGFNFTNALQYEDCLEVILRLHNNSGALTAREQQSSCFAEIQTAYGNDELTRSEALRLISTADFYATTFLTRELYPPRGQRMRVASMFGFIYKIDVDDPQIRELAVQASN